MLTLTAHLTPVIAALALGFLLGRVWEIRQRMRIPGQPTPPARMSEEAHRPASPRDLFSDSPMGLPAPGYLS